MTVIVAVPLPPSPPVDIPFSHLKAAAAAASSSASTTTVDPAVPRAVLTHTLVVAAAALPTLAPTLPSHEPEYRLASKRKNPHDDDDDENIDSPKRPRTDHQDPLFGPLSTPQTSTTSSPPPVISASTDVLSFTLEQAIVAILTTQEPAPQPATHQPASPALPPSNAVVPAPRLPTSPLASPSLFPTYEELETPTPILQRPLRLPQPSRIVETPLWKIACRTRVDTIIETYGREAVRATVAQEASRRLDRSPFGSKNNRPVVNVASPCTASELQVEIYTPSHFVASSSDLLDASDKSDSDFEDDVDMSFDLDESDGESEDDEAEEGGDIVDVDVDIDVVEASPHESVVDLPPVERCVPPDHSDVDRGRSSPSPFAAPPPLQTTQISIPRPISLPSIPPLMPPLLPRLSHIPVYCLRTYPDLPKLGTPSHVTPWSRGMLTRKDLQMQEQLSRIAGPKPVSW